jgi:hypothetical protein
VEAQKYTHSQNGNVKMYRIQPDISCSGVVKNEQVEDVKAVGLK